MKNKTILLLTLFSVVYSCNTSEKLKEKSKGLYLEQEEKNFGEITSTKKIELSINLINDSENIDSIISIVKSCGCTKVKENKIIIKPHSEGKISLIYNPEKDSGRIQKSVFLRTSKDEILTYRFKAFVKKN